MGWQARLQLDLRREGVRSVARFEHEGPLRILQALYPEGDAICHNVLVHPPGGLVGGDRLDLDFRVAEGAHGVLTTPGASRFYRSEGAAAVQSTRIAVAADARFEWLPHEVLCYSGCNAENRLVMQLAPGAEAFGWDVCALGLPASSKPFVAGSVLQHLELDGAWLERGRIAATDTRLMDGPLGLAGHRCLATLWWAAGSAQPQSRRDEALEAARRVLSADASVAIAGATSPHPQVVAVRVLAPLVEPAMELLRAVRAEWRSLLWRLDTSPQRLWAL